MNDFPREQGPVRKPDVRKPPVKEDHFRLRDPLPADDEAKRTQAVDRVPCGGGFRVLRRSRMLDSE